MAKNFDSSLSALTGYKDMREALLFGEGPAAVSGCVDSELVHLAAELCPPERSVLFLSYNEVRARELYEDAQTFSAQNPLFFPARDLLFSHADVQGSLLARRRMQVLKALSEGESCFVVSTVDALLARTVSPAFLRRRLIRLKSGTAADLGALPRRLAELGYERCSAVTMPGEFSVRGDILDVYPLTEENPFRVEFWGDDIDSIRSFDPETQRSLENLDEISLYPADESGDEAASLLDYLSAADIVVLDEPERMKEKAEAVAKECQESALRRLEEARAKGENEPALPALFEPAVLWPQMEKRHTLILTGLEYRNTPVRAAKAFTVSARAVQSYSGNFDLMIADLTKWKNQKYRIVLLSGSRSRAVRLSSQLNDYGLYAFFAEEENRAVMPGQILVTYGNIHKSFAYPTLRYAIISEGDLFGKKHRKKRRKFSEKGRKLSELSELGVGDYVIHEDHGLGVYRGIEKKIVDGIEKDYLKISYRDGGNLYVPVTQLQRIEKYASADIDKAPVLNRLDGAEWSRTKARVQKAVGVIAKDLVELYSVRQNMQGYAYGPDTVWQQEFEEQFPYEETEDQLKALEAVKADMESSRIMDRLICGDVGFGKTEIAIRAAFKAVQESRQVAYLVPTTILAQQHYNTFAERMKDYPVSVGLLSRFRTPAQQKALIGELKKGGCDIVIGTHRLLSGDVVFKDLGLLIIDEEQRFGVSDKEKIKKLRKNVDVISLTATPIPRTLHMSLIGIREMSVLEEPPLDRVPIQTYVTEYNDEIVREAIVRELARGGQVYFVSNKVKNIAEVAGRISALVPDAEVAYAHGQMPERELEEIMYDFVNGEIDVLVSTTIIETGLDIPNVNTIIIQDSERYGLAQLYQLRGRVGRSNRTAYAFLLYKGGRLLKEVAEKRLRAIRDYTELGSGLKISMRDLEIRGSGNLLGAEQHGHMEAVGYELYCKLLGAAVREEKGEAEEFRFDTAVDLAVDANLPPDYIANENQKMDIYRRISLISSEEDYEDMQDELIDRFGDLPRPTLNLLRIAALRARAHSAFVTEISGNLSELCVKLLKEAPLDPAELVALAREYKGALKLRAGDSPSLVLHFKPGEVLSASGLLEKAEELINRLPKSTYGNS